MTLPLRLDKIEKEFIRFEQNGQLKSYAFEIIGDLRSLQQENELLKKELEQARGSVLFQYGLSLELKIKQLQEELAAKAGDGERD